MSALVKEQQKKETPHYHGHRQRLRERFLNGGISALADYELLEMMLFSARPRGDVKPLAKKLISTFGSFANILNASSADLLKVEGLGESGLTAIRIVKAASELLLREEVMHRPIISSWTALLDYCRVAMAAKKVEEFRILFLNSKNELIADEVQQTGTVDHTPVYPREVVKRALEVGATSIILLHNHPSGDPAPSKADIDITKQIVAAANTLGVNIHDHLIIARKGHYSFKAHGLI